MKLRIAMFVACAVLLAGAQNTSPAAAATSDGPALTKPAASDAQMLPVGTALRIRLETRLSTSMSKPGDRFAGRVIEAVTLNGKQVIPVGASVEGHVTYVNEPRRIRGTPAIDLRPETVILPDGRRLTMAATLVDTSDRPNTDVNDEGEIKGRGHDGRDVKELGIGAGAGAGIGVLAGGLKGSLIGAGVGATAAVVHWLIRSRSAEVPAGTELIMELSRPMSLAPLAAREGGL